MIENLDTFASIYYLLCVLWELYKSHAPTTNPNWMNVWPVIWPIKGLKALLSGKGSYAMIDWFDNVECMLQIAWNITRFCRTFFVFAWIYLVSLYVFFGLFLGKKLCRLHVINVNMELIHMICLSIFFRVASLVPNDNTPRFYIYVLRKLWCNSIGFCIQVICDIAYLSTVMWTLICTLADNILKIATGACEKYHIMPNPHLCLWIYGTWPK